MAEKILTYFSDPAWWLAAVLVPLLGGMAGQWLYNNLAKVLPLLPKRVREWKEKRDARRDARVTLLASDFALLTLENFSVLRQMVAYGLLMITVLALSIIQRVDLTAGRPVSKVVVIVTSIGMVATMIFGVRLVNRMGVLVCANRAERNMLTEKQPSPPPPAR